MECFIKHLVGKGALFVPSIIQQGRLRHKDFSLRNREAFQEKSEFLSNKSTRIKGSKSNVKGKSLFPDQGELNMCDPQR